MKTKTLTGSILLLALLAGTLSSGPLAARGEAENTNLKKRLAPQVQAQLGQLNPGEMLTVIVSFEEQAALKNNTPQPSRPARDVIKTLRQQASISHQNMQPLLHQRKAEGKLAGSTPFWIFNGMAVTATREVIEEIAGLPGVSSVTPNYILQAPTAETGTAAVYETNQTVINAPGMWDMGYQGQGVVVAHLDTGVDYTHPDLVQQWRGGSNSWYDPYGEHPNTPYDANGHGTWTMGVMVGRANSGSFIGSAPQAKWISAKIFNDDGLASVVAIHLAFQWLLDPDGNPDTNDAPHVVSNSWSFMATGCYLDFSADIKALRAAGILPIFAAGNFGPDPGSALSPGNNPGAFAVGAVSNLDSIHIASSRGPSDCGGQVRPFPDMVAPGVSIKSSGLDGSYTWSTGTSLAAPHIAGGLALLLQAIPDLTVEEQEAALLASALDLGETGVDNVYGHGRFDVLKALESFGAIIPGTGGSGSTLSNPVYLPVMTKP